MPQLVNATVQPKKKKKKITGNTPPLVSILWVAKHTSFYCTLQILCVLKSKDFWQLCIKAILLVPISQQHLLTSCFCVTF